MDNSKIEWTDHTHNEWIGCEKISLGCKNCYAENLMDKRYKKAEWGANGTRVLTSLQNRNKPFSWDRKAKQEGVRIKVFAQSLSDTFEDRNELNEWRVDLFKKIKLTDNLDWLILTKRPNIAKVFFEKYPEFSNLPNVWLGVSVEDQKAANQRIPILLNIPAKVRFLSCEPLLGELYLDQVTIDEGDEYGDGGIFVNSLTGETWMRDGVEKEMPSRSKINWVIVGGESGPNCRPINSDWVKLIQYQCHQSNVPFFFKQWGGVNKKITGSLLDGREIKELPNP